ncbi:hypothetical protein HW561_09590 [Rhodobacteraceae bacterium B1Z28]|uniref:Bacteriophage replication gene A protein n=1 Tax=Ruegeria haliotis TaxID=2747601 RepID=A0ABX2PPH0_9RHOB|nr:hypothetical protein [Ruegeria haliotis]NVO56038.1 hypothetical protein [Ruegeria haliotis]
MKSKNQNSKAKPELKRTAKKQREKKEKCSHACKGMKNTEKQSKQWDKLSKQGTSIQDIDTFHPETVLKFPKYDNDADHSKKRHLEDCKKQKKTIYRCFKYRVFKNTNKDDFLALAGCKKLFADHMPACDVYARYRLGRLLIDEFQKLLPKLIYDRNSKMFMVTIVDDKHHVNERGGTFEVSAFKEKVQSAIRTYTSFDAVGVIEVHPFVNYPFESKGKSISLHAHLICWGRDAKELKVLKKRAKGFKSKITRLPIHSKKIDKIEGHVSGAIRYLLKPHCKGKAVDPRKFGKGERCLYNSRGLKLPHHLRLFEFGAKLPIVQTVFGVNDGVAVRKRVVAKLESWHKERPGTMIELEHRVYPLFETFLADDKKLKNYRPFVVNWRKPSRCKKSKR